MKKFLNLFAVAAVLMLPGLAMAAPETVTTTTGTAVTNNAGSSIGSGLAVIGAGLAVIGAGRGIGQIGGSALESIARQPAEAARIAANMIIAAALVEGAALFAIVVAFLVGFLK